VSTSWTDPDAEYEGAIERFLVGMLDRPSNASFLHDVEQFVMSLAPQGRWNALARLVVHLTAPGVPDLYQGDELFFRALVDPDNRRPVEWDKRARALDALADGLGPAADADSMAAAPLEEWAARPEDDGLKLYVTTRLLHLRRERSAFFARATYRPLDAEGAARAHVLAFQRAQPADALLVVVPRLTCGLRGVVPIREAWGDTVIRLPAGDTDHAWRCELGGQVVHSRNGLLDLGELLSRLPVAVLAPHR
jgi:(1->4)-alpha-D-glucan 1-alpha-D-glucosylmutase